MTMNQSQKYKITVLGQSYTVVSDEAESVLLAAAKTVDVMMREVAPHALEADVAKVAVLTALRLALKNAELEQQLAEHMASHTRLINLLNHAEAL